MLVVPRLLTGLVSGFCCLSMLLMAAECSVHVPAHDVGLFFNSLSPLLPLAVAVAITDILILGRERFFRHGMAYLSLFACIVLLVVANTWRDALNKDHYLAIKGIWDAFTLKSGGPVIGLSIVIYVVSAQRNRRATMEQETPSVSAT